MKLNLYIFCISLTLLVSSSTVLAEDRLVPGEYLTIQAGIDAAVDGDTVVVSQGTYNENVVINKGVILTSTNPDDPAVAGNTIIDAGGSDSAVTFSGGDPNNTYSLEGFTITGGNSAGIKCQSGNITISNCIVTNNIHYTPSAGKGGGISNISANLTVIDCTFTGNTAFGSGNNGGYGGGIFSDNGELLVVGCQFIGNSSGQEGGAIANDYNKTTIKDSVFIDNSSDTGGAINSSHYPLITSNCTFINNMARLGGAVYQKGLYLGDMTCRINNCTLYENIATEYGGAAGIGYEGNLVIRNSILWNNIAYIEGPQISNSSSDDISVSYSCIRGGQGDIHSGGSLNWLSGNIDADPLFADAASGDLHLKSQAGRWDPGTTSWAIDGSHSPCIDTGDPADLNWVKEPWHNGNRINMGAFGGTNQASKSTSTAGNIADINSNGLVDMTDLMLLLQKWLVVDNSLREDLNRDGTVNIKDFAVLVDNWGLSE
jgi:hypothetical protein